MINLDIIDVPTVLRFPEPRWLIQDYLHECEIAVLYGAPNMGKSFVALDWAMSIAAGVPWLDEHPTLQTPVLYMAGEGTASIQKRVDAWLFKHDLKTVPVYFQTRPLPLREEETVSAIQDALETFQIDEDHEPGLNPGFIVVDTLSQFFGGGDENGFDMAQFVSNIRDLSQEQRASILIVHHTNKGGEQERGHTALRGNVDVMFRVEGKMQDNLLRTIEILNDKQRDSARTKPGTLAVESLRQSLVLSRAIQEFVPLRLRRLTSDSLRNLIIVAGTLEGTFDEIVPLQDWLLGQPLSRSKFYEKLHILLDLKLVKTAGRGQYKLTPAGRETAEYYRKKAQNPYNPPSQLCGGFPLGTPASKRDEGKVPGDNPPKRSLFRKEE